MTIDQHLRILTGDMVLKIAEQAAQIDALRDALAAEQAKSSAPPQSDTDRKAG